MDSIPNEYRNSSILTGNNLGQLGNIEILPSNEEIEQYKKENKLSFKSESDKHTFIKSVLEVNKIKDAWCIILS